VSRRRTPFAILISLLLSALGLSACGSTSHHGIPAGAVAAVEGKGVTAAEVNHWLAVAAYSNAAGTLLEKHPEVPVPPAYSECISSLQAVAVEQHTHPAPTPAKLHRACEEQYQVLRERAIAFLINVNWTFAEAERLGNSLSSSEVDAEYAKLKARSFPTPAALASLEARTRETVADLRLHAKLTLAQEKIQHHVLSGVSQPSEAQIASYYAANKRQYAARETRDVRIILTREPGQANQALRELRAGASFATVAQARSIDPASREKGGLLTGVTREQGNPEVIKAIFAAQPGRVGGPINTVQGYYIYEVVKSTLLPAETLAQARPKIKKVLFEQRGEAALKAFAAKFPKTWKPKTECRPNYVVPKCKESPTPAT
jgi:parvulin-like peptidyl-prolyl isomerase